MILYLNYKFSFIFFHKQLQIPYICFRRKIFK